MRGKGQKGHSILITGRSEGFVNLVFQLSHLVERKLTSLLSSAHFFFTGFVFLFRNGYFCSLLLIVLGGFLSHLLKWLKIDFFLPEIQDP